MGMYHTMPSWFGGVRLLADRVKGIVPLLGFGFVSWGYSFVCLLAYIVHIFIYSIIPFCYFFMVFCMDSMTDSVGGFLIPMNNRLYTI